MTSVPKSMMELPVAVPQSVFAAPAHSRIVLEGGLRRLLAELAEKRVRRADAILPALRDVHHETWSGATKRVQDALEAYRADAERLTAAYIEDAETNLRAARLAEQAQGAVAKSALYKTLTGSLTEITLLDWESELAPMLQKLIEPEKHFGERLRAMGTGRLGRAAAYAKLQTACQVLLDDSIAAIDERCRRMLHARIAAYVGLRSANIETNRKLILDAAIDDAKSRARDMALQQTAISQRTTSVNHDASIPPSVEVIEHVVLGAVPFANEGQLRLDSFWVVFGSWATARKQLPAEEVATDGDLPLARAIRLCLEDQSRTVFSGLTLGDVYAKAGATLPLADLQARSQVPVDFESVMGLTRQANQEVRAAAIPANLQGAHLASGWVRKVARDPNRLKLMQDFKGFSARTVLGRSLPEWQAALDAHAIAREASTPILRDAIIRHRIVERLRGEFAERRENGSSAAPAWMADPHGPDESGASAARPTPEEQRLANLSERGVHENGSTPARNVAE